MEATPGAVQLVAASWPWGQLLFLVPAAPSARNLQHEASSSVVVAMHWAMTQGVSEHLSLCTQPEVVLEAGPADFGQLTPSTGL